MSKKEIGSYTLAPIDYPVVNIGLGWTKINGETIFPQDIKVEVRTPDGTDVWVDIEDIVDSYLKEFYNHE